MEFGTTLRRLDLKSDGALAKAAVRTIQFDTNVGGGDDALSFESTKQKKKKKKNAFMKAHRDDVRARYQGLKWDTCK